MPHTRGIDRRLLLRAGAALSLGLVARAAGASGPCAPTPSQTAGPFFPVGEAVDRDVDLTRIGGGVAVARGEVIRVVGTILEASCRPVAGALVHLWQADAFGRYRHPADPNPATPDPNFQGSAQAVTDSSGRYAFKTIKPAAYPRRILDGQPDPRAGYRTPHIHFRVSTRGFRELTTQMYFAGEPLNDSDGIFLAVPAAERPRVVIRPMRDHADAIPVYRFDMHVARG
ncbi:MAG TPA: protocatechuate 3,4-dioxygenase [Steroidobacteraceae bacterium]|nr:protocatechuate 3,4-dioxygenase [Steroidobacteraceae bacterium]